MSIFDAPHYNFFEEKFVQINLLDSRQKWRMADDNESWNKLSDTK